MGDPVYSFRKATQDRYLYDPLDRKFVHLNPTPFVLDDTQNAKLKGTPRHFGEVSAEVLTLPAVQRIYQTMAELTRQNMQLPALPAAASDEHRILVSCHIFMIYTEPGAESADFAEPTPEGVHQDGAEHVMVLLLGRENVEADSARSQIFSLKQDIGPSPGEDSPELLFASELKEPGEAIFMADRLVKHSATPVRPADPCKPAWRMVMVAWSRRPTVGDRLDLHEKFGWTGPCTVGPGRASHKRPSRAVQARAGGPRNCTAPQCATSGSQFELILASLGSAVEIAGLSVESILSTWAFCGIIPRSMDDHGHLAQCPEKK